MDLEQWTVGGRSFGWVFVFLLLAGEIYTTFTFLGRRGFAYGLGAPVYYILAYGTLAYVLSYFMLPPSGATRGARLVSQPHFFVRKYDSPALGVLVALVGVAALIPYLVLQLKGLASSSRRPVRRDFVDRGDLDRRRGGDGLRDRFRHARLGVEFGREGHLDSGVVLFLGIYLPIHYFGGIGDMFDAIDAAKPGLPGLPREGFERGLVRLDRAADRARLLHVAAFVRFDFHGEGRSVFSGGTRWCCRSIS